MARSLFDGLGCRACLSTLSQRAERPAAWRRRVGGGWVEPRGLQPGSFRALPSQRGEW